MLIVDRQKKLLELVRSRGSAQLDELARSLEVSQSTVRRDLELFEKRGIVQRIHGGVLYIGEGADQQPSLALAARMAEQIEAKEAIGAAVAGLVQPNMTLIMDGGSTVVYAARAITARPIQVVTNSISIANIYKDDDQVEVLMVGGRFYPRTEVTVGPIATGTLAELHADILLFSLAGIRGDAAYNINLSMARVEQVMLQQAQRSVMLMDATKFDRTSLVRVCGLDEVDHIITDPAVAPAWRERLGEHLIVAE
jgi:DeoR/GlpR family transcriptional regulator of sugar metabolism